MTLAYPANNFLIYLITPGEVAEDDLASGRDRLKDLASAAAEAGIDMFQIREKNLSARSVLAVAEAVLLAAEGSSMRVLINDRADIASASGAHGVHLTATSLDAGVVRSAFGGSITVGVSTHDGDEIRDAVAGGADFVTFSPIFETDSKKMFGPPQGIGKLGSAVVAAAGVPLIALGGVTLENALSCREAGASGIAGIGMFRDAAKLASVVGALRS